MAYTPKIVGEMLDLPPSTLRRYATDYGDFLSESARQTGKKRFYTDSDIPILRRISKYTRQRKPKDEIIKLLSVEPDRPPGETPQETALTLLPDVIQAFEIVRAKISYQDSEIESLREELDQTRADLRRLESWFSLPWYKRVGRRPPEPPKSE